MRSAEAYKNSFNLKGALVICFFFFFSLESFAYIPGFRMILDQTAQKNGRGAYQIQQEVVFQKEGEPILIEETWTVIDSEDMRVDVRGQGFYEDLISFSYIYDSGKKYFFDENKKKRVSSYSTDWVEPYFHVRSGKSFTQMLVLAQILPSQALLAPPKPHSLKNIHFEPTPFLRLSRSSGVVSYAFGEKSNEKKPGIWIEQDRFVVRKIRLPSGAQIWADHFSRNANDLWFPKARKFSFNDESVQVNTKNIVPISVGPKVKKMMSPSLFENENHKFDFPDKIVGEFYRRFR